MDADDTPVRADAADVADVADSEDEQTEEEGPISFKQMEKLLKMQVTELNKQIDRQLETKLDEKIGPLERRVLDLEEKIDEKAEGAVIESMKRAGVELQKMMEENEEIAAKVKELEESIKSEGNKTVTGNTRGPTQPKTEEEVPLFSGPIPLPSLEQRKQDILYASNKLNMYFPGTISGKDDAAKRATALGKVLAAVQHEGTRESPLTVADVKPAGADTRVVVQFEKSATKKASQLRTEARNRWSPMDGHGNKTHLLRDTDGKEIKVKMYSPEWTNVYNQPLYELKSHYCAQFSVPENEVHVDAKKRGMVMHGENVLAVRRFDGAVVASPYLMKKCHTNAVV